LFWPQALVVLRKPQPVHNALTTVHYNLLLSVHYKLILHSLWSAASAIYELWLPLNCPRKVVYSWTWHSHVFFYYIPFSHATDKPGIATPHVTSIDIDPSFKYLILMSDGVYKTLEAVHRQGGRNGNDLIVDMINQYINEHRFGKNMAKDILDSIRQTQYDLYQRSASEDARSDITVANRKRDDMTLVICSLAVQVTY